MSLKNFQEVPSLTVRFDGRGASIYGKNATGKTTLYNAFCWVLFGRASDNSITNYTPKTNGSDGRKLHHLDHSAEMVFEVDDGRIVKLTKNFHEIWEKKRGKEPEKPKGNTTDCFIDDVPTSNGEYAAAVTALLGDAERVKMLTMPDYFAKTLHWETRRKILLEICGDTTDADVMASTAELADLPGYLEKPGTSGQFYTVDEYKKVAAVRRTDINKQMQEIPGRIDEATTAIPEIDSMDVAAIDMRLADLKEQIKEAAEKRAQAMTGDQVLSELRTLVAETQAALSEARAAHFAKADESDRDMREELRKAMDDKAAAQAQLNAYRVEYAQIEDDIDQRTLKVDELRVSWTTLNAERWNEDEAVCPTCQRPLPDEDVERMREEYNQRKSDRLMEIRAAGQAEAAEVTAKTKTLKEIEFGVAETRKQIDALDACADELLGSIKNPEPFEQTDEHVTLSAKLIAYKKRQSAAGEGISDAVTILDQEMSDLNSQIEACQTQKTRIEQTKTQQARIKELKRLEKDLAAKFEDIERGLYLCGLFTQRKASMLTDRINNKFHSLSIRLFTEQQNGEIKDGCEVMIPGKDSLTDFTNANTGARMLAGLEIINVLSAHWGMQIPLFVDNAESVTDDLQADGQIIRLYASKADEKLRLVLDGTAAASVA